MVGLAYLWKDRTSSLRYFVLCSIPLFYTILTRKRFHRWESNPGDGDKFCLWTVALDCASVNLLMIVKVRPSRRERFFALVDNLWEIKHFTLSVLSEATFYQLKLDHPVNKIKVGWMFRITSWIMFWE